MCWHIAEQNQWWFYLSRKELSDGLPGQREQYPSCIGWEEEEEEEEEDPISDFLPLRCPGSQKGGVIYPKLKSALLWKQGSSEEHFQGEHAYVFFFQKIPLHGEEGRDTFPSTPAREKSKAKMTSFEGKKGEKRTLSARFRNWQKIKSLKMHDVLKDGFFEFQEVTEFCHFFASKVGDFFRTYLASAVQRSTYRRLCAWGMRFSHKKQQHNYKQEQEQTLFKVLRRWK